MPFPKASPRLQGERPKILGLFGHHEDSPYKAGKWFVKHDKPTHAGTRG